MSVPKSQEHPPLLDLVGVGFARSGREILADIDWRIAPRERWAVLGPNGCGKSTLLKLALGMLWPTAGTIRRLGQDLVDLQAFRRRIGWITDAVADLVPAREPVLDTVLSGMFGQVGLTLFAGMEIDAPTRRRAGLLLERLGCGGLGDRTFGVLSQGERRQVLVARAMAADPLCLVLDEPCAGMDPGARERFLGWLGPLLRDSAGPAVVLVTHHLEEILPEFTDTLVLRQGRVLARGRTADVLGPAALEAVYGARVERFVHCSGRLWPIWDGATAVGVVDGEKSVTRAGVVIDSPPCPPHRSPEEKP